MNDMTGGQVEYWNDVLDTKTFSHPVNAARLRRLVGRGARVVEIGCGYGRVLEILAGEGFTDLSGFDTSPKMIAAARQRLPAARLECLREPTLPLADASADAVLLIAVLTCVPSDREQRAIVREAERVLRPAGVLYISDLWLQNDERNRKRYARGVPGVDRHGVFELPEGVVLRHQTREWIDELTAEFKQIALDEMKVRTMNGHTARGFQWFGRRRGRLDEGAGQRRKLA